MNRPHGRCRLFHCVSYLPLPSNTCTRWFSRSATYTQPSASQVMLCAMLNSPGSVPGPSKKPETVPKYLETVNNLITLIETMTDAPRIESKENQLREREGQQQGPEQREYGR